MKITCQSCQSKYTVSDEKVQGKTVKIKCRKCGATILVNSGGVTTSGAGADADSMSAVGTAEGGAQPTFQVNVADGDQRSMSLQDIVAAYNTSVITAETYVWADGMGDWQPLGQVESIVAALNNPASVAAATATPPPAAYAPPAAAYTPPAAAYAPPAAAYAPPVAAQAPVAAYAAPEPVAAPAPEPEPRAAARRDPGRRAPDLFGGGGGMAQQSVEEVGSNAPHYNGSGGNALPMARGVPPQATGGREENSMLFSLSALTAKAATNAIASSSSKTTASREDSGVIDLKALAASSAPAQASPATDILGDHASLFPLGAPIAAAAPVPIAMPSLPPPAASKTPIFIGIGVAVAAIAIVGAFFAMKGGDKPPPVETAQAAPPPPPTPTLDVAPPPTVAAEPSAAPSASVATTKKAGPIRGGGGGTKPSTGSGGTTTGGGATTAAPTKPKSGGCGCAPGDLMCAMKCSAK